MTTYISLLRGINVSGQKKIKMAELRDWLADSGFSNLQTYIQSGNLVFNLPESQTGQINRTIAEQIKKKSGFEVPVITMTGAYLQSVENGNPFVKREGIEHKRLAVAFLSDQPTSENIQALQSIDIRDEEFVLGNRCLYLYYPNGIGRAKLTNNLIERKLKINATSRNLRTIGKLLELASVSQ